MNKGECHSGMCICRICAPMCRSWTIFVHNWIRRIPRPRHPPESGVTRVTIGSTSTSLLSFHGRSVTKRAGLLALLALAGLGSAQAATYYIRTDGGSASQCTGTSNAAYPGSGSNRACAWNSLHQALPASGSARINGGDTVYIAPGEYMLGWGAPGAAGGRCYDGGRYDCYLPPIPSGPSASQRTRILGLDAARPPVLWGTERVSSMLNLNGSSNVEIGHLEITDKSECVEFHSNAGARCRRDSTPYGQWAGVGISASNSRNVYLHDLDIHGLANRGIIAGGLTDWTLERVKIIGNPWAGWDGDIGSGSSNSGNIIMRQVEIAWNGCGEKLDGTPWACWAQTASGYGDGLGTARTGGHWLIEDSYIHHNTSDGLDLLYMDGASNSSVTVRRTHAVGNAGNQLKTYGRATIENSVVVGNCAYFDGRDFMKDSDQCRALGNTISVGLVSGQNVDIRHNTITGQGDCLLLSEAGSSSSTLNIQNNAFVGQTDWRQPSELTCGHYAYNSSAKVNYSGNLFWNVKSGQCPGGSTCSNPKLVATALGGFDATPQSGSPLIDKAPYLAAITNDFYGNGRPSGPAADIGAIEVQVGGGQPDPQPVCTRVKPSLAITGPSESAPGESETYTLVLANNDSAGCASTSFSLARTLPAAWTGSLAANSLDVAPGRSGTTTLSAVIPGNASAGNYALAVASSSSAGSIHTASDTVTLALSIDAPPPTCTRRTPSISLDPPSGSVAPGGTATLTGRITNNDTAACGTTSFALARTIPSGWSGNFSANTVAISPGSSTSATLTLRVASDATPGSHAVAFGTSSALSGLHTVADDASVRVAQSSIPGFSLDVRGDFDGDGRSDVLWRHTVEGWNSIWKKANPTEYQYLSEVSNVDWKIAGIADFDGDGKDDILWRNVRNGRNTIWRSADSAMQTPLTTVSNLDWEPVAVADFDADGRADIFWRNARNGRNVLWHGGSYATRTNAMLVGNLDWKVVGTSDFNGDGHSDLLWRNARSGANTVWMSANGQTQKRLTTVSNTAWQIVGVDDFDGDEVPDILWRNQRNGRNVIWYSGEFASSTSITTVPGLAWQVASTGDFDGDGQADIFWRHAGTGQDVIWEDAEYSKLRRLDTVSMSWEVARP
ncbi:FG-GAP-like repeat-containing protein [Marilutibacter penaei]|nr:FG-GAP-like repeat-containing protein [Lysobacter penaei]